MRDKALLFSRRLLLVLVVIFEQRVLLYFKRLCVQLACCELKMQMLTIKTVARFACCRLFLCVCVVCVVVILRRKNKWIAKSSHKSLALI